MEETSDLSVNDDLTNSVLRNSIENLESFIDEKVAEIETRTEGAQASVTIDKEKIREFREGLQKQQIIISITDV